MYMSGEAESDAIARVIRSEKLIRSWGDSISETTSFEKEWAQKIGVPHALAVSTGTAALICGLIAIGVEPGDEVIVPGYTFIATAMAPLNIGAVPVLAEVDAGLMLDPTDVARKITPRTKAIIPVHMSGHVVNLEPILRLAREKGIKVLEDCCQCDGGSYRGLRVGSHGDAGAFSFNFFKILSCGEGGAVVTRELANYQRARIYHDSGTGWRSDAKDLFVPLFAGVNYRMDEVRAAMMRVQLGRLEGILSALRSRCSRLRALLVGNPVIDFAPVHDESGDCGVSLFLRVESRADALRFMAVARENKLPCSLPLDSAPHVFSNWTPLMQRRGAFHPTVDPLHITEAGRAQRYAPDMLPQTLANLSRTISIGINPLWTDMEVNLLAEKLLAAVNAGAALCAKAEMGNTV